MADLLSSLTHHKDHPFKPPSKKFVWKVTEGLRNYFDPHFFGLENTAKDRPALYVTNHTIYGVTDGVLFTAELYYKKDIFLRALVDKFHYKIPVWRDFIEDLGMVRGSRDNCAALMEAGEHIVVYPGGGRETFKKKGEAHKLTWKSRTGFARMAIQHGYDIIPIAQVGGDDAYTILADSDDILNSFIGKLLLKKTGIAAKYFKGGEYLPPIARGVGFTPLPRPERLYLSFGQRIDTQRFAGKQDDEQTLWTLRKEVEDRLNAQIDTLLEMKAHEPDTEEWRKLLKKL